MGWKVILSPQCLADLEQIVSYIAKNNPAAAERLGLSLLDRTAILQEFPELGSEYSKRNGVRKLTSRPYIILYRINASSRTVDILRFWHGFRNEPPFR
jgi:toxin ParE1/3/4